MGISWNPLSYFAAAAAAAAVCVANEFMLACLLFLLVAVARVFLSRIEISPPGANDRDRWLQFLE